MSPQLVSMPGETGRFRLELSATSGSLISSPKFTPTPEAPTGGAESMPSYDSDAVSLLDTTKSARSWPTLASSGSRFRASPKLITASDLVDRRFELAQPDQLWVTDITEHRTREGKLYCCVVLDTFSRRVVGWSIDSSQTAALTSNALTMAIENRTPTPDSGLIIHSDHGTQFTAWAFTHRAQQSGLLPSNGVSR